MRIKEITKEILPTITLEHKGEEFYLDLNHVLKIILLFAIIGLAYNMGAYVEAYNVQLIEQASDPLNPFNVTLG